MYYFYMKSLQESLFDDNIKKGIHMNVDAVEDYVRDIIESYKFKKYNSYDSLSRTYSIEKQQQIFYLTLSGHVSYNNTRKSPRSILSRTFDYDVGIHFDQYDNGAVVNYVGVKFWPGSSIQNEGFAIIPSGKTDYIEIKSDNIKEILDKYVNLFDKVETYFHSNEFIKIVEDGKLDKPEWGLSNVLYNRRLSKYKAAVKDVVNDLKNIAKEFKK